MIDFNRVKRDSVGKWPEIFFQLRVAVGHGEHRPCPACGGKDRFRFDDKDGRGTWFCNQCGAGDGIALLKRTMGLSYADSIRRIADIIGHIDYPVEGKPKSSKMDPRQLLNAVWRSSQPLTGDDLVTKYLRSRGLVMAINDARFCPECYESDTKTKMPAMVALVRNVYGKPVTIHRTFLDGFEKAKIREPKKLMPCIEKLNGCAIRLFDVAETVGVAEGIETAIAARQLFDVPTWATVSSTIMESFEPPAGIRRIIIFSDCDSNYSGQAAAYKLAKRLYNKDYIVEVQLPEFGDWADQLKQIYS